MLYKKDIKRSFNTETDSNQEQLFTLQFRTFFVLFFSPWELDHHRTWKCLMYCFLLYLLVSTRAVIGQFSGPYSPVRPAKI